MIIEALIIGVSFIVGCFILLAAAAFRSGNIKTKYQRGPGEKTQYGPK